MQPDLEKLAEAWLARRLQWIAEREGIRKGKSLPWCEELIGRCDGNLRAAIHQLKLEA